MISWTQRRLSHASRRPTPAPRGRLLASLGRILLAIGASLIVIVAPAPAAASSAGGTAPQAPADASPGQASPEKRPASHPEKASRPPRVEMAPSSRKAAVGDTLTIRVRIENGADVGSVPFHFVYNPQVLEFESGEEGSFLKHDGAQTAFFASPMSAPGEIVVGLSRLGNDKGANGSGDLCLLRFRVIASGDAGLAFKRASVKDPRDKILARTFRASRITAK